MLDIKILRSEPDRIREALKKRNNALDIIDRQGKADAFHIDIRRFGDDDADCYCE